MAPSKDAHKDTIRAHWKCLAACTLVSMCPFQYGIDFGVIGGLQAMPGFLEVCLTYLDFTHILILSGFWK